MVHAVRVPAFNAIYFVMGEAAAKPGWTVEPGAWLDIPVNSFYGFREESIRYYPAIFQAADDPLHYKIYMEPEQADPEEWRPTRLIFGGIYSEERWRQAVPTLPEGSEPPPEMTPGQLAQFEEVMRNIRGGEQCLGTARVF